MGILQSMGIGRGKSKSSATRRPPGVRPSGAGGGSATAARPAGARPPGKGGAKGRPAPAGKGGKRGAKGAKSGTGERVSPAAAPLHDRRRRLVGAREATLRDLGGLMLEMYKRNRFREELLLDKCEEVLAIEVEIAHVDQRLFQLAPGNTAGQRPIGRCECGSPILPGQNFCGVCGRAFGTLTQPRTCSRCGSGLRVSDSYCATCGAQAPDLLEVVEQPLASTAAQLSAPELATAAADTIVLETPPELDTSQALAPGAPDATVAIPAIDVAAPAPAAAPGDVVPGPPPGAGANDATQIVPIILTPPEPGSDIAIAAATDASSEERSPTPLEPRAARKLAKEKRKRAEQIKRARAKAAKDRARVRARDAKPGGDE
jgi:hypothetical protein